MGAEIGSAWVPKQQFVSFDVFDTLIKRSVAMPTDLFQLVEQYCMNTGMHIPSGFAQKRREAEHRAADKKTTPICLDEIYRELREEFGTAVHELKELEIKFELDGCRPNPLCADLLRRCVDEGKTVVLISDMYLSSHIIGKMLAKCGIRGYKKLYVSCEMGARKSNGSLYKAVLREMRINPSQLFHLGDNLKADFLQPLKLGIMAKIVDNGQKALCKHPKGLPEQAAFSYRTMMACIKNSSYGLTVYEKMGCEVLGPQLYGFIQWLIKSIVKYNIHDVYFMARDGYIMKKAFDKLGADDISTHYLYCSRRSYQVPLIWKHSRFDEVIIPFAHSDNMTLREFLSRIGLLADEYKNKVEQFGLKLDRVYNKGTFFTDIIIRRFYDSIRADIEDNSKREYNALVTYLSSVNMKGKIAVVDIGYQGTMQYALKEIVMSEGWDVEIKGFYYGVNANSPYIMTKKIDATGYLYDVDKGDDIQENISLCRRIFETQYVAPHGSVEKFEYVGGKSIPVLFPFEYMISDKQITNEINIISEYQSGTLKLIDYMITSIPAEAINIDPNTAIYKFTQIGTMPTLKQAQFWGDMRFFNDSIVYIARPHCILYYLKHLKALKKEIYSSCWKIGFLRRLFRVKLPYRRFVQLRRRLN